MDDLDFCGNECISRSKGDFDIIIASQIADKTRTSCVYAIPSDDYGPWPYRPAAKPGESAATSVPTTTTTSTGDRIL